MTPIHELLSRIRWDKEFGSARFELGYFDRVDGTIHRVALQDMAVPEGERRVFELLDELGQVQRIPFHRVREVYRNGERIWHRPHHEPRDDKVPREEHGPGSLFPN